MHKVSADKLKRVRIPDAKPGQVFICEQEGEGRYVLTVVRKTLAKPRPLDRHLYDNYPAEAAALEEATASWAQQEPA